MTDQNELNNTADAIADRLLVSTVDLPEGFVVECETSDLKLLAQMLRQKLPVEPYIRDARGMPISARRIPEGSFLIWHGTSLSRADSVLELGFRNNRGGVFFSSNIMMGAYASGARAQREGGEPAIFAASCDFSKFEYGKEFHAENHVTETHYVFRAFIANRIVKYLLTCHGLYSIGKILTEGERFRDNMTDITITQNSGVAGIAYWLNSFLNLDNSRRISEAHPAVGQIKAWIDEQYVGGRTQPITDEELLELITEVLPELRNGKV
ncbi:hypothetical protein ACFL6S_18965 [Candidatus Poribacteria bacterium]